MFPKALDYHKSDKPLVPNGLGVIYILASAIYLFVIHLNESLFEGSGILQTTGQVSPPLTLAVCILFGGFLGLLDDWMDLKWRYKAFLPLIAALPLISFALSAGVRTSIFLPFIGVIDFGAYYFYLVIPLMVTVVANTVNQLGGLNGLESGCPAIIMVGLAMTSLIMLLLSSSFVSYTFLLVFPLIIWLSLAFLNFKGKIFVGNTGSFAFGMTIVAFAVISDLKLGLVVSILPFVFNSLMILLTFFLFRTKASVSFDGKKLSSNHRRSLITFIAYNRSLTERQLVFIISILIAASTFLGSTFQLLSLL